MSAAGGGAAGAGLAGMRILIPRDDDGHWADAVRERGGGPVVSPLIGMKLLNGAVDAWQRLAAGEFDGLVVTSAWAVAALREGTDADLGSARTPAVALPSGFVGTPPMVAVSAGLRIAAVGSATAEAVCAWWPDVDVFVPRGGTAEALAAEWPEPLPSRILWPRSARAADTIATGLRARGTDVDDVVAYEPVPREPSLELRTLLAAGDLDAALVTSPSIAERLADIGVPASCRLIAIGPTTAAAMRGHGLAVAAVAATRTIDALLDALAASILASGEIPTPKPR